MTRGATIATKTIAITSAAPMSPLTVRKRLIVVLSEPDSRIEVEIEQIDGEIGEHDHGCDDEHRRLDQGNVAIEKRLIGHPPNAGVVKMVLVNGIDDKRAP